MDTKSSDRIRKLVIVGALSALAIFLGITRLGLIPWISGASITILHIPAIIGAIIEGPFVGAGIGAIFGIFSLIQANTSGTLIDVAFRNPLVSVLPRILFPLVAWALYAGISKWKKIPAVIISSVVASVVHTVMVLGMLVATNGSGILTGGVEGQTVWAVIGLIFVANGIPEAIAAGVLTTLVVAAWLGFNSGKKSKLGSEK
jgi:uncharacterized membrane protein